MSNPRETQRLKKESMAESSSLFETKERSAAGGGSDSPVKNRYTSTQFNVLRGTGREVLGESLSLGKIGANGLHRYDVKPEMSGGGQGPSFRLADYYMKELKDKKGTTDYRGGPLFIIKGLHNYTNQPCGDDRVVRASCTQHEQYLHPEDRAPVPPHFEHLQACSEKLDNDRALGPLSALTVSTAFAPSLSAVEEREMLARTRIYRDAVENVKPPSAVDALQRLMRDKLDMYAGGKGGSGYAVRSSFRFFDRDARGAVDLVGFRLALTKLGIAVDDRMCVALFSRYDLKRRGHIDYHEFISKVMEADFISKNEVMVVSGKIKALIAYYKDEGTFANLRVNSDKCDVHQLTDDEFMARQRIKAIFYSLDRDQSGVLDFGEFGRMLKVVGCVLSPLDVQAIWTYVDENGNNTISFDEFYEFYTSAPPPPSSNRSQASSVGY